MVLGSGDRPTIRRIGCCIGSTSKLMAGSYPVRPGGSINVPRPKVNEAASTRVAWNSGAMPPFATAFDHAT